MVKTAITIVEYASKFGMRGFIALLVLAFLGVIVLGGMASYFLLSVIFPEYIIFGWYWWRFLALGILILIVS